MHNIWKQIFYLQKNDRKALLVLLAVIIIAFLLVFYTGSRYKRADMSKEDSLRFYGHNGSVRPLYSKNGEKYYQVNGRQASLFPFDPNTADSTQLLALGLQPWQVRSIYCYRAKGGIYRQPEDFARLYGLTLKQYKQLAPYIHIGQGYQPASDFYTKNPKTSEMSGKNAERDTILYPLKLRLGQYVQLNTADTSALKKVPGIGSGYAKMIVSYRNRLGGYVHIQQLLEIDGFPEEALHYFKVNPLNVNKLNLNKLTLNQMRRHPYINFYQAREICDYRRLKGPLHSLADLHLFKDFSPEEIQRLAPYVRF